MVAPAFASLAALRGIISGRKIRVALIAIAATLYSSPPARAQETARFYFNPPMDPVAGLSFIQRVRTTKSREAGGQSGPIEVSEARSRVTIKRTVDGFDVVNEPLGLDVTRGGTPANNPLLALTQQFPVTYRLDPLGRLREVRGYEKMMEVMREKMPPQTFEATSRILNENTLVNRDTAEWNGRFGNLVDLTATLGYGFAAEEQFPLPTGGSVKFYTATRFEGREKANGRDCVRIVFSFNTDAADIAKFLGKSVEEIKKTIKGGEAPSRVSDVEVEGQGVRIIEPATMLIHLEKMERIIFMKTAAPGGGEAETLMRESREHVFEYPDLGKLPQPTPFGR